MYTQQHKEFMYEHYLHLFHTAPHFECRSFARKHSNFWGRELGMTENELREDKLPFVDFAALMGCKGSVAGDGEE